MWFSVCVWGGGSVSEGMWFSVCVCGRGGAGFSE